LDDQKPLSDSVKRNAKKFSISCGLTIEWE
jgi:hypothetical protein